jgi:hypothetical protein
MTGNYTLPWAMTEWREESARERWNGMEWRGSTMWTSIGRVFGKVPAETCVYMARPCLLISSVCHIFSFISFFASLEHFRKHALLLGIFFDMLVGYTLALVGRKDGGMDCVGCLYFYNTIIMVVRCVLERGL